MRNKLHLPFLGNLVYPKLCAVCERKLSQKDLPMCLTCEFKLPKTNFHKESENEFTERFWNRIPLVNGSSIFFYRKAGLAARLIHQFKYHNKREVGLQLGESYGAILAQTATFQDIDIIVPVPLHRDKLRKRGYNQSAIFGSGLSSKMGIPMLKDGLRRIIFTNTQTRKGTLERLENVEDIFEVAESKSFEGKHILLIDDVMTTGATLEACAIPILRLPNTRISMVTMAIAVD